MARARPILVGAFFLALVLGLFAPSLVGGKVLSAADVVWFQPPFFVDRPGDLARPSNAALTDPVMVFGPDLWRAREALYDGSIGVWSPNVGAGRPLLASQQHAPFFPTQWLAFVLPFWHAFAWIAALKLLAAALGTFLLCRALGLGRRPVGARRCGVRLLGLHDHLAAAPAHERLAAAALARARRRATVREGRAAAALALSALFGLLLLAGHPESAAHGARRRRRLRGFELFEARRDGRLAAPGATRVRIGWLAAAFVGGVLLSAVVTLPVVELFRNGFSDPRGEAPPPASVLWSWVFPEMWSRPDKLFDDSPDPRGPFNYPERTAYLGALPVLLALGGLAWRPQRASSSSSGLGALALLIMLPTPLNELVRALPGGDSLALTRLLSWPRSRARCLPAFGLQRLLDAPPALRRRMLASWPSWRPCRCCGWPDTRACSRNGGTPLDQLPAAESRNAPRTWLALGAVLRWALLALGGVAALALACRLGPRSRMAVIGTALAHHRVRPRHAQPRLSTAGRAGPGRSARVRGAARRPSEGRQRPASWAPTCPCCPTSRRRYGVRDPRAHDHPVIDRYQRLYAALGGGPPDAADDPA